MSKKYIQRALMSALTLLLALAVLAVPTFADDAAAPADPTSADEVNPPANPALDDSASAPADTAVESGGRVFTWTEDEPLSLTLCADDGFRMPDFFLLRINDAVYTVFTNGAENPEGIVYDPATAKLTVADTLIHDGDSFAIIGSAIGVRVDAGGLTDIAVTTDLSRDFSAAQPLALALTPAEGCAFPPELHFVLDDILYTVYTDGTVYNDGIAFDTVSNVLTIDASYLKIGQTLTLSGEAVRTEPDVEEETDPTLRVTVDVTALENINFTETASHTALMRGQGNALTLVPGQELVLDVAPADGTVLPEAISVIICRADGSVLAESFRFDGNGNAPFLAFDPAAQQLHIAAGVILDLDTIILAPAIAQDGDPVPTPTPSDEPTDEPTTEPDSEPTDEPTPAPSDEPTDEPTPAPSTEPTDEPTPAPSTEPTDEPTPAPSAEPADEPTPAPSTEPTDEPTPAPSAEPAKDPVPVPVNSDTPSAA